MPKHVICVGVRTGPDAENLLIVDIDGESALTYCTELCCCVEDSGWIIARDTDLTRLKVVFRITNDELSDQLALRGKIVISTCESPKEQIELFYGSGQCIVLGQHLASGGHYFWTGLPKQISKPSVAWEGLIQNLLKNKKISSQKVSPGCSWSDCVPCPICGRTELDCRITDDRSFIQCHKGHRWHPPDLSLGETIIAHEATWAYVGASENAIGPCANFKINETRKVTACIPGKSLLKDLNIRPARGGRANVGKVDWAIQGFAAVGIVLLAAEPGTGKTTLLYRVAEVIQEGKDFLNAVPVKQGSVLVIQGDEPENITMRKLNRMDVKGQFEILYGDKSLDTNSLSEIVRSKSWRVIIVDSLTTVLASSNCTTMDMTMAERLYELNKLASENNVLVLMTAHLNKPSRDGSGAPMKRKIIAWADISGVATISAAVNDAWGLTPKDNCFSLHALGKRHVEAGTEWILERFPEDYDWELKEVTDSLMPKEDANIKSLIVSFLGKN